MSDKMASIRSLAQLADDVHWVLEVSDKPTWRERLRRWVRPEPYQLDPTDIKPRPWTDRPAGAYEREGWRIRTAYAGSDMAFQVEYVVCAACGIGWVESPYTYEGYTRCGLASAALRALRRAYPGAEWHTAGGHFRDSKPFWAYVSEGVPGGYTQLDRCLHVEPWQVK